MMPVENPLVDKADFVHIKKLMFKIEIKSTCEILSSLLHVLEPSTLAPLSTTQNLIQFLPTSSVLLRLLVILPVIRLLVIPPVI